MFESSFALRKFGLMAVLRCIEIFCTFLVHSIVLFIFYIGIFLSVSGFGHAICNSSRNKHAVILLDMMLRSQIAIMNGRWKLLSHSLNFTRIPGHGG